jgi:hypothetical protein
VTWLLEPVRGAADSLCIRTLDILCNIAMRKSSRAKQSKAEQSSAKQSKAEQSRAKQSKGEQRSAAQSKAE